MQSLQQPMIITTGRQTTVTSNDMNRLFAQPTRPLHVDLGMGNGKFVYQAAKRYPEINWLGVESNALEIMQAQKNASKPNNLIFSWMNAEQLPQILPPEQVNRFYIQFCTPITNPRQQQLQLTSQRFLSIYRSLLTADGDLIFKTDHQQLYAFTLQQIQYAKWTIIEELADYAASQKYDKRCTTTWEQRMIDSKTPIRYLRFRPN